MLQGATGTIRTTDDRRFTKSGRGSSTEGLEYCRKALENTDSQTVKVECWFYIFTNGPPNQRVEAKKELKKVLQAGGRSSGWDFRLNIWRAFLTNHPDLHWISRLAEIISEGDANIDELNLWSEWVSE